MSSSSSRQGTLFPPHQSPEVTLVFDGGSLGNPGKGYGSFIYRGTISTPEPVRLEFPGRTTNNEAEYYSLLQGLRTIISELQHQNLDPSTADVRILSDSKLVVEQVSGRWKVKHEGLKPHHQNALDLLRRFRAWRLEWHPRSESVRMLGH